MLARWNFTVLTVISSSRAMSRLGSPLARRSSTASSRGESTEAKAGWTTCSSIMDRSYGRRGKGGTGDGPAGPARSGRNDPGSRGGSERAAEGLAAHGRGRLHAHQLEHGGGHVEQVHALEGAGVDAGAG